MKKDGWKVFSQLIRTVSQSNEGTKRITVKAGSEDRRDLLPNFALKQMNFYWNVFFHNVKC